MLQTNELCKVYKPKRGVPVTALKNVTLSFPERGMVFLTGKSGSGKSTLLNVLGGLDNYTSGEILIKGVSSMAFRQQHFDSYRNTYVGFVFQEYNLLDEFTVGANIALAIELQNKRATDEQINSILEKLDLSGYGNRKPNELSGGQKQRVAIARALVKNPEIIMADEPTGALDSVTGRQILETLKRLSHDSLVIVVSHDREFASKYADRIIELADGEVIRDVEQVPCADDLQMEPGVAFDGSTVRLPAGYHLTEEDRIAINDYIDSIGTEDVSLTVDAHSDDARHFRNTETTAGKAYSGSTFKLIKSKLPMKNAFKIGCGGLRHKKVRLVFTILLSFIAFSLFGLSDTMGSYNHVRTCTESIIDSSVPDAAMSKSFKSGSGINQYWIDNGNLMSDTDVETLQSETGLGFSGVYTPRNVNLSYSENLTDSTGTLIERLCGFVEMTDDDLSRLDFELIAGRLPDGSKDEIAVSKFVLESFIKAGYKYNDTKQAVTTAQDLVGKVLSLDREYTVTGVVDTGFDSSRYDMLNEEVENSVQTSEKLIRLVLCEELRYVSDYSFTGAAIVGKGFIGDLTAKLPAGTQTGTGWLYINNGDDSFGVSPSSVAKLSEIDTGITWLDGERTTLGEKEIILSADCFDLNKGWYQDKNAEEASVDELNTAIDISTLGNVNVSIYQPINETDINETDWKIVGLIETGSGITDTVVLPDSAYSKLIMTPDGRYNFAIAPMPSERDEITELVKYSYREDVGIRYELQNPVTFELNTVNNVVKVFSNIFFWIGIGFALFAALMLSGFIATSIAYKKREIGILRAIGSRSNDVFRIFYSESFVIAMINFVLASVTTFVTTEFINHLIRRQEILITVLHFGPRQIILLFLVSILVSLISCFLPINRIARKRPVDAIREN